jgi:hypothetical protein
MCPGPDRTTTMTAVRCLALRLCFLYRVVLIINLASVFGVVKLISGTNFTLTAGSPEDELYYSPPLFPLTYPNLTIAALTTHGTSYFQQDTQPSFLGGLSTVIYNPPSIDLQNPILETGAYFDLTLLPLVKAPNPLGVISAFGIICQIDQYNRGGGQIPFNGKFKLYAFDTNTHLTQSVYSAMYLLRSNLYIDQQRMSPYPKIVSMFGSGDFRSFLASSPFFGGVDLPTIGYGSRFVGLERHSTNTGVSQNLRSTIFELDGIFSDAITDITIELANSLGWTLGAYIFVGNSFGYQGEAQLLRKLEMGTEFVPRCSNIAPVSGAVAVVDQFVEFVDCVKGTNQLNYVVLYMSFEDGIRIIEELIGIGIPDTVMFLIALREPTNSLFDNSIALDPRMASRVMYIQASYSEDVAKLTKECISELQSEQPDEFAKVREYVKDIYERVFQCIIAPSESPANFTLPYCDENVQLRPGTSCYCTLNEISANYDDLVRQWKADYLCKTH